MNPSFQDVGTAVGCCKKLVIYHIRYKLGVRARVTAAAVSLHCNGDPDTWLSTSSSKGTALPFFFVVVVVRFQVVLECDKRIFSIKERRKDSLQK
jgi:hypothetical protein